MIIIPSILETDPAELARKIALVTPYVRRVQIDIADATLGPAKSIVDMMQLKRILEPYLQTGIGFTAHCMVAKPEAYVKGLVDAGFSTIIAQVECADPRTFIAEAETHDVLVELAIDVDTDFEQLEPFLDDIDGVVVMTAPVGDTKGVYEPEEVEKVTTIHRNLPDLPICAKGGITNDVIPVLKEAGVSAVAVSSILFNNEAEIGQTIVSLEK